MFQNDFLEATSRVHPVTPFVFYIPMIFALTGWGLWSGTTTVGRAALYFPLGWLTWQLMEYAIHRGWFHWEGNGHLSRRFHEIVHGYHHEYPDDGMRLVMPLGASLPLAAIVAALLWTFRRPDLTLPLFCGIVAGYLWYDFLHYRIHHHKPRTAWGRAVRAHHMAHHFACPDRNFGISHRWLDRLLGTLRTRQKPEA
jgi:sterol desaturase/sphingolipid hydroxylase (fatty acid hydroxylase superfamily)